MEKVRQKELIQWLKQQSIVSRRWLNISRLLEVIGGILIIVQSWILAQILHHMVIDTIQYKMLLLLLSILMLVFVLRAWIVWLRERVGFYTGQYIRCEIRHQLLNKLEEAGPIKIQSNPAGSWATHVFEQVENMHDYYAHYLPQIVQATYVPLLIFIAILLVNWVVALILLITAPLTPLFMVLIGTGAADANRRNFLALARLGGYFLDRLRGIETLRVFGYSKTEMENIYLASQDFRQCTMEVLRIAFLSSGVLEFFASLSTALVAVYFGFSYLGAINFSYHGATMVTFSTGFLVLILVPELFRPLRDLGTLYHAKAQAVGAADNIKTFLEAPLMNPKCGNIILSSNEHFTIVAENFSVLSSDGIILVGPLNFTLSAGQRVVLVGASGSGKSSLLNALSGFMTYTGSLRINNTELCTIEPNTWRKQLSWVGQNPQLLTATLRDNVLLGRPDASEDELKLALDHALVSEFLPLLPNGIDTVIGDQGAGLSVGQAQRVAVARAMLHPCHLLLLDEPIANLDVYSAKCVMTALNTASHQQTTLMATHQLEELTDWDSIWVIDNGLIVEQGDFVTLTNAQGYFTALLANNCCYEDI